MRQRHGLPEKQRGAVAVITGLAAVILVAFLGLTVDLGHAYVGTSELQNAADAAALAGAKELNQTAAGVTAAVNKAIAIAAQHNYNFSTPVSITIDNIRVGSCPNPSTTNTFGRPASRSPSCSFVAASSITSNALAAGMTFLEVDTSTQNLSTYFMRVVAIDTVGVAGYAVAGRFITDVTPIGVCAIDPDNRTSKYTYGDGSTELLELGFRRGVSYNIVGLNPLGGASGVPFLINPVDAPPAACDPNHSSANFTAPFICQGSSAVAGTLTADTQVYVNTGLSAGPMQRALNSRFDDFGGGSPCDPGTAPPDSNIKEFKAADVIPPPSPPAVGHPRDWMQAGASTLPSQQTVSLNTLNANKPNYWPTSPFTPTLPSPPNPSTLPFVQYGALWSYTHAYHADGSSPPKAGTAFDATNAEWAKLYNNNAPTFGGFNLLDTANYPGAAGTGFPSGTPAAPYNQTSGNYFVAPTHPGVRNRRVLNIVIVDCSTLGSGGLSCAPLTVKGIGKFFMQVRANLTGSPQRIDTEFAGLIDPTPTPDVRLYR